LYGTPINGELIAVEK